MMGIQPSEIKTLSLREYQGLMHRWNDAHAEASDIEPPTPEEAEAAFAHARAIGMLN